MSPLEGNPRPSRAGRSQHGKIATTEVSEHPSVMRDLIASAVEGKARRYEGQGRVIDLVQSLC